MGILECGMYGNMGMCVLEYDVCMYGNMYVCMFGNMGMCVWEYGNVVCMGIWECIMVIWECGMYGIFGNVLWEYGNVRTTVLIFLQQQNLFFSAYIHVPAQAMLNLSTNKAFYYR